MQSVMKGTGGVSKVTGGMDCFGKIFETCDCCWVFTSEKVLECLWGIDAERACASDPMGSAGCGFPGLCRELVIDQFGNIDLRVFVLSSYGFAEPCPLNNRVGGICPGLFLFEVCKHGWKGRCFTVSIVVFSMYSGLRVVEHAAAGGKEGRMKWLSCDCA